MSKSNFKKVSIVCLVVLFSIGISLIVRAATMVDLGTADSFAVLAGSGITDSNPSVITGDVGLDPTGGAAIPGLTCAEVTGTIYDNNAGYTGGNAPGLIGCLITDDPLVTLAKTDLVTAYNDAAGQITTGVISADLGGQTLTPGVYEDNNAPDSLSITGTLTLDAEGDPDAVFIFKSGSTLVTGAGSSIVLANEAQACNIHWQVTSSATLGVGSTFVGNILALTSITDNGGSTVDGRLLARNGAVTLDDTTVTVPTCSNAATISVIKVVNGGDSDASDFSLFVQENGVNVNNSPANGAGGLGTTYSLSAGTYVISEGDTNNYTKSFSGDCDANGSITILANTDYTCTVTNTYNAPSSSGSRSSRTRTETPVVVTPEVIPVVVAPVVSNPTPTLPATGYPPQNKSTLPIMIIALLTLLSISIYFVRKNQTN